MPTFLLKTWSMPADVDHACDYALVDIWPSTARQLLARHEAFAAMRARDAQLYEVSYWDYSPQFFSCADMPEEWARRADREETIQLPGGPPLEDGYALSYAYGQLIVRQEEICWTVRPRHMDVAVTTARILIEQLRRISETPEEPEGKDSDED